MKKRSGLYYLFFFLFFFHNFCDAQSNVVMYAGNSGKECFYDVLQLSNGTFLVSGYAQNLNWISPSTPQTTLGTNGIHNGLGSNQYGFILQLSPDLQTILHVVKFPQGSVEDIRFLKTTNLPEIRECGARQP